MCRRGGKASGVAVGVCWQLALHQDLSNAAAVFRNIWQLALHQVLSNAAAVFRNMCTPLSSCFFARFLLSSVELRLARIARCNLSNVLTVCMLPDDVRLAHDNSTLHGASVGTKNHRTDMPGCHPGAETPSVCLEQWTQTVRNPSAS